MPFEPHVGSLIEFDAGDEHRIAVVTGTVGKKKLVIHTADGDEMRTTLSQISFDLGTTSPDDLDGAKQKVSRLEAAVEARRAEVELPILWEFTREEDDPLTGAELAEVMFADDAPTTVLGMLRALRDDAVFFQARRDGTFEARPEAQVEELREQQKARLEKERAHQAVLQTIVEVLTLSEEARPEKIQAAMGDNDALRDKIYLLQDFAAHGEEFSRRQEAEEFLDELVKARGGRQLKGRIGLKAFHLMRELGLWDEHFNLTLHRYHISPDFSPELLQAAEELAAQPWEPENWRRDLTHLTTITVDALESRDLDDALSCQATIDGGFELFIHIADPSAIIAIDSTLDREARKRGTSVYLPTGSVPMFPHLLSEGRLSLNEGELRPAMTTRVVYDEALELVETEVFPSLVQVDRRMTYDEVDQILESDDSGRFPDLLANLQHIAGENYRRRVDLGAFSFDLPETRIAVDLSVDPPAVTLRAVDTDTAARGLVSELMILNNELVGRFLSRNDIPAIYRTQESPDEALIDEEILAIPEGPARAFAQIRRMKRGEFSTAAGLHFGLGIHGYAQASSPIRRFADLVCQRQIKAFLNAEPLPYDDEAIMELCALVSTTAAQANEAERDTQRYWLYFALAQQGDLPLDAVLTEIKDERSGRVSVFLLDCAYRSNCTLESKLALGDHLRVVVDRAHPRNDVLTLRQAPEASSP